MTEEKRTVEQLKKTALIYWPEHVASEAHERSPITLLLETQESFISVLKLATKTHDAWISAIELSDELYPNLFLKHLCVISDVGGESLKRYSTELPSLFENQKFIYNYKDRECTCEMLSLFEGSKWSNSSLGLAAAKVKNKMRMTESMKDVATLILFGSLCTSVKLPQEILTKCKIGSMLGEKTELENFIRQRYIEVSRQITGIDANLRGHIIENYLKELLQKKLPDWDFTKKTIEGVYQREKKNKKRSLMKFDIVAKSPTGLAWGIESSFQFTSNSTFERKANEAPHRQEIVHAKGHKLAYALDGAGIFERSSALETLIETSDYTVNFSEEDIFRLVEEMKKSESGD